MTSNKKLRARGRRDRPGSGPNYDKAHGLIPRQPDPPKGGKYPNSPAPLIELVVKWCKQHGYHRAIHAIKTQTQKWEATGGYTKPCSWDQASNRYPTLVEMFEEWKTLHPEIPEWMPASEYHAKFILPDALKKEEERKKKEERKKRDEKGEFSDTSISEDDEDDEDDDEEDWEDQEDQEGVEDQEDENSESESEAGGSVANEVVQPENIPLPESDSGSEEESESDSDESEESESNSDSESEASENEEKSHPTTEVNSAANPLKRKAPASSSSSDSESDSGPDSESSEDEEPQLSTGLKSSGGGLKRKASSSSTSEDDSSDEETSDEEPVAKKAKLEEPNESTGSSSSSGEESDEEMEDAASTNSEGSSSSDEESDDDESESEGETGSDEEDEDEEDEEESGGEAKSLLKHAVKPSTKPNSGRDIVVTNGNASDSSQTLHATSPQFTATELSNNKIGKANLNNDKPNAPFSRISVDQQVDPKFSSNKYVSYDYADKAHRDLIVTKGKNFTKEKNKKKRGAYRGGMIDTASRGIKFED